MRARIHLPNGTKIVINTVPKEIERLSALKDHRVELLPERDVFVPGARWLYHDIRDPAGNA